MEGDCSFQCDMRDWNCVPVRNSDGMVQVANGYAYCSACGNGNLIVETS